jgi:hypothetical protein
MKKTLIRIVLATLFLIACGATQMAADGFPRPDFCPPGAICPN